MLNRISTFFYVRPKLVLAILLLPPLLWFLVIYIGSLISLLINSFFSLDSFTGQIVREFTLKTYAKLFDPSNMQIFARTTIMAALVTIACAILAFPLSYYMARFASPRMKTLLYMAVTLPLWSSYVVRVYSWKLILAQEGIVSWFADLIHLDGLLSWYCRFLLWVVRRLRFHPQEFFWSLSISGFHTWFCQFKLLWNVCQVSDRSLR